MKKLFHNTVQTTLMLLSLLIVSCERFLEIEPPQNELVASTVFSDDATAQSALRGVYAKLTEYSFSSGYSTSVAALAALCADEIIYTNVASNRLEFLNNALKPANTEVASNWYSLYTTVYYANSLLEGLEKSSTLSPEVSRQLEGEGRFLRAFCNFYLVNLWGDVPLILTTDYRQNGSPHRAGSDDVYASVVDDLRRAQELLPGNYDAGGGERIRANKFVVSAFLARVYLYLGDWANAEQQASVVIDNSVAYQLEPDLDKVFLKNSQEAIWQLFSTDAYLETYEGLLYIPNPNSISRGIKPNYIISDGLLSDFDTDDQRRTHWTNSVQIQTETYTYPFKYKVLFPVPGSEKSEYSMVLRLAEQYLIRAEARARLDKVFGADGAQGDVDIIRARAGLPGTTAITKDEMLLAIEHERRIELFSEWGHRWFDLIRTNRSSDVLGAIKPDWQIEDERWPIPQAERTINSNLTQNSGY